MVTPPYIRDFASRVVERAQRNLGAERRVNGKRRRAVASGRLKENLTYKVIGTPNGYSVFFTAKGEAQKYARYVEYGRRPNKRPPPIEAIEKWMKVKPVRVRRQGRIVKQTEKEIRRAAYAIAQKIGRDGIPALNYYKDAVQDTKEEMQSSIAAAHVKALVAKRFGRNIR